MANFKSWWELGYGAELVPVIPHDAMIAEGSSVKLEMRGKTPGLKRDNGWVGLGGPWSEKLLPGPKQLQQWQKMGAYVGRQGRRFPAVDIDVDVEKASHAIQDLAFEHLGDAPVRWRKKSARRLLPYRRADGVVIRKRRIAFLINGEKHAVDILGHGQYYNVEGIHPSGEPYRWSAAVEAGDLAEIDDAKLNKFMAALVGYLETMGYQIVTDAAAGSSTTRKSLDDTSLYAPDPRMVLEALQAWRNTPENVPTHEDFVAVLAAIKASLGEAREDFYPIVLEWALEYDGNTEEYVRKIWDSIKDAAAGWSVLASRAHAAGYTGDAQVDFADDDEEKDPSRNIPTTPIEKMLGRYAYVKKQNEYYDTTNGSSYSSKGFNAVNTGVADFGRSGVQSAESIFQNAPGARKVDTLTSRPGAPVITEEANESGMLVAAVNLWRPSSVKPYLHASIADVVLWLDLVDMLFGPAGTPEREHFLDWWAFLLQNPGVKIGYAMVITGAQGTGKDTVLKPMFEAVGVHNIASIDTNTLFGQWNHYLRYQVVYVQEIKTNGNRNLYNHIKPYISGQASLLGVNEKNRRQYFVPNIQNWIVTSNYDNAITLEDGDRRFWVHRVLIEEPPPDDYFSRLHSWLDSGGTEKVLGWLLQRGISGFNPMARPPMTAAKQTMLEQSEPAPSRFLRGLFAEGSAFAGRTVVTVGDVLKAARGDWRTPDGVHSKNAIAVLKAEGFKPAHRVRIGRETPQLWARETAGPLDQEKMRERYLVEAGGGDAAGGARRDAA